MRTHKNYIRRQSKRENYWGTPTRIDRFPGMAVFPHTIYRYQINDSGMCLPFIPFNPQTNHPPFIYYTHPLRLGSINFQNQASKFLNHLRRTRRSQISLQNLPTSKNLRTSRPPNIPRRKIWPRSAFSHTTVVLFAFCIDRC